MPRLEHFGYGFNDRQSAAFGYFIEGTHGQNMPPGSGEPDDAEGSDPTPTGPDHDDHARRGHKEPGGGIRGGGEDTRDYSNTLGEIAGLGISGKDAKDFKKVLKKMAKKHPGTMSVERSGGGGKKVKMFVKDNGVVTLHATGEPRGLKNIERDIKGGLRHGGHIE
jgi:hypothetical protein